MKIGWTDRRSRENGGYGTTLYFGDLKTTIQMRLRTLPFAAALVISTLAEAQTKTKAAEVDWGRELNDKEDGNFQTVMETSDDAIYVWMNRKKEQLIQKMGLDLKVIYQKPFDKNLLEEERELAKILLMKDRIIVFTRKYDKKADRNDLYARAYNEADYSPIAPEKRIASIAADKENNSGYFSVGFAYDEKSIRVGITEPRVKKMETKSSVKFLDFDLEEMSGGDAPEEVQRDFPEDFSTDDAITTDDGAYMCVGRKYPEKREQKELRRQNKPDHTYWLLVFEKGSTTPQEYPIQVADKFLQDLTFKEDINGDIICGGFYGNKSSWAIRGVFFLRLDKANKQVQHESYKEFSDDFITEGMSEKEEKKAQRKADRKDEELELSNYRLDRMVRRQDGGMVMVAEEYRSYTVCTQTKYGQSCNTHYIYNDIIAVNIDPQGNIEWAAKIPKRQHTVNDGGYFSSYAMHVKGDNIYFLFNDNGENLFLKPGDKYKQFELKGDDALVTLATIEGDGHVRREAMFNQERKGTIFKPNECRSLPDDRMFIYATRKSEYRFGIITFL